MSEKEPESWDIFHGGESLFILDEAGCRDVADRVRSCEDLWIERDIIPGHPIKFHTLGGATYIDSSKRTYESHRASSAGRMLDLFDDLYVVLCDKLGVVLGNDVIVAGDLAPPGFHIYQGTSESGVGLFYGGSIHVDIPHNEHVDKYPDIDGVLSFTLPIQLPRLSPSGMYYWVERPMWNIRLQDIFGCQPYQLSEDQFAWLDENKREVHYNLGEVVLHEGWTPHQLGNMCRTDSDDWRITLQGHGILSGGIWSIYF